MEDTIVREDQWLTDGDCSRCRRQAYCSKRCRKAQVRFEQECYSFIAEKTGMGAIMNTLLDYSNPPYVNTRQTDTVTDNYGQDKRW